MLASVAITLLTVAGCDAGTMSMSQPRRNEPQPVDRQEAPVTSAKATPDGHASVDREERSLSPSPVAARDLRSATRQETPAASTSAVAAPAELNPVPLRELHTGPNDQYFYSGDWAEVDAAVKQHGLKLSTNRPLGYVFRRSSDATQKIYRLKNKATGSRLVSTYQPEIDELIESGRFVMEGSIGAMYRSPAAGAEQVNRYSNGRGWRMAYASQDAAMRQAGYRLDGRMGYLLKQYYRVGAYYFGTWNLDTNQGLLNGVERVYGRRNDWWGGIKDFYGQEPGIPQDTRGWEGDFSHLKPAIGYYDDALPATVEQHIDQAADHGLSYFSFYWYYDNATKQPQYDAGLEAFLRADNRRRIEFTVSPCFHNYGTLALRRAEFQAAANLIADYTTQANYLTTQSGRPVFFMCDTRGIEDTDVAAANDFIGVLVNAVKAKTGRTPFIMNHSEYGLTYARQLRGDAYACLNIGRYIQSGNYREYVQRMHEYFAAFDQAGKPMQRCAMSGFDERPRTDILIEASRARYFRDSSREQFAAATQATRSSMNQAPASEIDNYLTVYAWNEWHEGGVIEPNVRDGDHYLRVLQNTFGLVAVP
jgi:hypothetical protein